MDTWLRLSAVLLLVLGLGACGGEGEERSSPESTEIALGGMDNDTDIRTPEGEPGEGMAPSAAPVPMEMAGDVGAVEEMLGRKMGDLGASGGDAFKRMAGKVKRSDLETYLRLVKKLKAAGGDEDPVQALGSDALQFSVLSARLGPRIARYASRKQAGTLTEEDKAFAEIYDQILEVTN